MEGGRDEGNMVVKIYKSEYACFSFQKLLNTSLFRKANNLHSLSHYRPGQVLKAQGG